MIESPRDLKLMEIADPEPGPGEMLVNVKASGICGTDVHVYEGEVPLAKLPVVPGHEFSGIVETVGDDIIDISPGDRVAIEPNLFCGYCHFCRNAKKHFCENWGAVGLTQDGGFAEKAIIPRQAAYMLPGNVDFKAGAFFEPVACVLHGIERSGVQAGDSAVVLGAGSIGLIYLQILKAMGVRNVIISDIDDSKLAIANKLGASAIYNPLNDDLIKEVQDITGGFGAEVVIDAAGSEKSLLQTFELVQDTGTIVIFGVPPEKVRLPIRMYDIYRRELSIVGSFTNPYTNERALRLLDNNSVNFNDIVTHEIKLNAVEETMVKMRDKTETVIKAQITF